MYEFLHCYFLITYNTFLLQPVQSSPPEETTSSPIKKEETSRASSTTTTTTGIQKQEGQFHKLVKDRLAWLIIGIVFIGTWVFKYHISLCVILQKVVVSIKYCRYNELMFNSRYFFFFIFFFCLFYSDYILTVGYIRCTYATPQNIKNTAHTQSRRSSFPSTHFQTWLIVKWLIF